VTASSKTPSEVDKMIISRDLIGARLRGVTDIKTRSRLQRQREKLSERILSELEKQLDT
jgi:hypothetical protein